MLACYHREVQLIPAVDVLGNDAVRLERGDYERVLFRQPLAEYIVKVVTATAPALLHVVDLQGARDGAFRDSVLDTALSAAPGTPLQVSGGIRSAAHARKVLDAGASRVIIGTAAFATENALDELVAVLGDALVVALDVKNGLVATRGWLSSSGLSAVDALRRCQAAGVQRIHATAIDRDGTMEGPDLSLYHALCGKGIAIVAAGGVRSAADVAALESAGCEAAVMGTALAIELGVMDA